MARLPVPGSDKGTWGDVLNDYLGQSINSDGTLKDIQQSQVLGLNSALSNKASITQLSAKANDADLATVAKSGSYNDLADKPVIAGSPPDASSTVKGVIRLTGDLGGTATTPTVPGLASKLDTSTASSTYETQAHASTTYSPKASPTFTGTVTVPAPSNATDAATKTYVDSTVSSATPDATSSVKGKVQLTGDLGGTAASPTVPGLANKLDASTASSTYETQTHASSTFAPKASPTFTGTVTIPAPSNGTDAATKTYVDSTVSSATPDATTTTKGKIQLAGDLAGTAASPTVPGLANKLDTTTAASTYETQTHATSTFAPKASPTFTGTVTVPAPSNPTDASTKSYVDTAISGGATPDATTTSKGKIQLAGDLAGTAASPTVPGLANKLDTTTAASTYAPKASPTFTGSVTVPTPSSPTDATTKTYVDSAISGASTPDATTSAKGKLQLAGDLAGTAASPIVAKVNGVTLPASAPTAAGQVLTATSPTATAWTAPGSAPVSSVAGKTGTVTLVQNDIANLTSDLSTITTNISNNTNNISTLQTTVPTKLNITDAQTTYAPLITVASVINSSTTATANAYNPVDVTTGSVTITLPTPTSTGTYISIEKQDATTNTVTVSGTIRGSSSSLVLGNRYETAEFISDASGSWWPTTGQGTSLAVTSAYDTRAQSRAFAIAMAVVL